MDTIVYMTGLVCITLIILMSMYTERSYTAVKRYKGQLLTLQRDIKKYEKQIKAELSSMEKKSIFKNLKIPDVVGNEILDTAKELGIPESALLSIASNPDIVKGLIGKLSNLKDIKNTSEGV